VFGRLMASVLYEGGAFTRADAMWVWAALAGSGVGLLAGTMGRLYASASFAMGDTRVPFRFAVVRVVLGALAGVVLATQLPTYFGVEAQLGIGFLTLSSGLAARVECWLLKRHVERMVGVVQLPPNLEPTLWGVAALASAGGVAMLVALPPLHAVWEGLAVLGTFGALYFALARVTGVDRARRA